MLNTQRKNRIKVVIKILRKNNNNEIIHIDTHVIDKYKIKSNNRKSNKPNEYYPISHTKIVSIQSENEIYI